MKKLCSSVDFSQQWLPLSVAYGALAQHAGKKLLLLLLLLLLH